MATHEIGSVGVRVLPNTRGFARKVREDLQRIKNIDVYVNVIPRLKRRAIRNQLQDQLDELKDLRINVDAVANLRQIRQQAKKIEQVVDDVDVVLLPQFDKNRFLRVNNELSDLIRDVEVNIDLDKDSGRAVRQMLNEIEREMHDLNQMSLFENLDDRELMWIHRRMDDAVESARHLKHQIELATHQASRLDEQLDDVAKDREARIDANPMTAWASARLAWLTRARIVDIIPRVSRAAITKTLTALAALSGARLTWTYIDRFQRWMGELDKNLPRITFGVTGLTTAFSGLMGSISGLVGIGDGLAATLPSLLLLPGLMAGAVVSIVAIAVALKDAKTELAELGDSYRNLGKIIKENFWREARQPIISLSRSVMPQLERSFQRTSAAIGRFTARIATSFEREFAGGRLEKMFDGLAAAWDVLSTGTDAFAGAITNLGLVAAKYMPGLAQWFVDLSITFDNWLSDVSTDGRLDQWLMEAKEAFYDIWDVMAATQGIFAGLWRAAEAGGSGGLSGFADMLLEWERAVNGAKWQRTLTAMFRGAGRALSGFNVGLKAFGNMLDENRREIEYFMGTAGVALGSFFAAIAEALEQPAVKRGLADLIDGLADGLKSLEPALGPLGEAFGTLLSFMGELARVVGPVLSEALQVLAPLLVDVLEALTPLLPQLGEAFITAIEELTPYLEDFVQWFIDALPSIVDFGEKVLENAPTIVLLAGAFMLALNAAKWLFGAAKSVFDLFEKHGGRFSDFSGKVGGLAGALARVAGIAGAVIWAIVNMWQNSERFRDSVGRLFGKLGELIGKLGELGGAFLGLNGDSESTAKLWKFMGDSISFVLDGITTGIGFVIPLIESFTTYLGSMAEGVGKLFTGDFGGAFEAFESAGRKSADALANGMKSAWSEAGALALDTLGMQEKLGLSDAEMREVGRSVGISISDGTEEGATSAFDPSVYAALGGQAGQGFYFGAGAADPSLSPWIAAPGLNAEPFSLSGVAAADAFYQGASTPMGTDGLPWKGIPWAIDTTPYENAGQLSADAFLYGFDSAQPEQNIVAIDPEPYRQAAHAAGVAFSSSLQETIASTEIAVAQVNVSADAFNAAAETVGASFKQTITQSIGQTNLSLVAMSIIRTLLQGFSNSQSGVNNSAKNLGDGAKASLASSAGGSYTIGAQFGQGFANGIAGQIQSAANAAAALAASAMAAAKAELDIRSPSRRARDELGIMVGRGFAGGLTDSIPLVRRAMNSMVDRSLTDASGRMVGMSDLNRPRPVAVGGSALTSHVVNFTVHNPVVRDPFNDDWNDANEKGLFD